MAPDEIEEAVNVDLSRVQRIKFDRLEGTGGLTHREHNARAALLGMVYDAFTNSYRYASPGGGKYKYTGSLRADTLEPIPMGVVSNIEKTLNIGNTISSIRRGVFDG